MSVCGVQEAVVRGHRRVAHVQAHVGVAAQVSVRAGVDLVNNFSIFRIKAVVFET